jgi:hypothetical protein
MADVPISEKERSDAQSQSLPVHNGEQMKEKTPGVRLEGESGRRGFHPIMFLRICFRSSCFLSKLVNFLWPFVPVALAMVSGIPRSGEYRILRE